MLPLKKESILRKLFKNHKLLMVVGCLLPIAVLGIFLTVGFTDNTLFFLLILLCPLAHLFLMKDHGKNKKHH